MRFVLTVCTFLLLIPLVLISQEKPQHPGKLYVDSTGQVFTRVDQPAYFFVTPAEESGNLTAVPSADPNATPMYWDGEGVHYISYRDVKSNKTISFRIIADGVPPVSKLEFNSGLIFNIDSKYFVESGATATISSSDRMTGVAQSFASINGDSYIEVSGVLTFPNEGNQQILLYSVDNVGNAEEPTEYNIISSDEAVVQMDNIYFDLNSTQLRRESIAEIDKLVLLLKKYPNIQIELKAHTDSRGDSRYNLELSNARAKSVVSYMQSRGIEANRLTAKGYGDSQPINECKKGVKCSEAMHKANRRVEFRISKMN